MSRCFHSPIAARQQNDPNHLLIPKDMNNYGALLAAEEAGLQRSQYISLTQIRHERENKLKRLILHAYEHCEFYHQRLDGISVSPDQIRNEDDISLLPLVRKRDFLTVLPSSLLADNIPARRRAEGVTSGSTGEPFRHFLDKKFNPVLKANLYQTWRWAGVDPEEYTVHCSAPHASNNTPHTLFLHPHEIQTQKKEFIRQIRASGARILRGYPLTNFELLWMLFREGCHDIKFTHAFLVGHALSRGIRNFFKREFNCEIYHYYASQETGPLASECEHHDGFHIHEESFVIEIADNAGRPLGDGERGEIVITSLINDVMPLIRYAIGDIGMIDSRPCTCGRTSRRIWVEGRCEDLLLRPDGQCIYPGILRDALDEYFFAFQRYQVVQIGPDEIMMRVVPAAGFSKELLMRATDEVTGCIGFPMKIKTEIVEHIAPLPNGKFQYFASPFWRNKFPDEMLKYPNIKLAA